MRTADQLALFGADSGFGEIAAQRFARLREPRNDGRDGDAGAGRRCPRRTSARPPPARGLRVARAEARAVAQAFAPRDRRRLPRCLPLGSAFDVDTSRNGARTGVSRRVPGAVCSALTERSSARSCVLRVDSGERNRPASAEPAARVSSTRRSARSASSVKMRAYRRSLGNSARSSVALNGMGMPVDRGGGDTASFIPPKMTGHGTAPGSGGILPRRAASRSPEAPEAPAALHVGRAAGRAQK